MAGYIDVMLEILRHDGPGRLGIFHIDDDKAMTPNFFSTDQEIDHELYLTQGSQPSRGPSVVDMGSVFSPGKTGTNTLSIFPDVPVGLDVPRNLAEFSVESTLEAGDKHPGMAGVICGSRYLDLRERCAVELADRPLLVIADGFKLLDRPRLLTEIISRVRSIISPNTALYFPLAPPHAFSLLAYMGVDLFDSGYGEVEAAKRRMCTTRGVMDVDSLKELPCTCSICAEKSPGEMTMGDVKAHNLNITHLACREIREAMRHSDLRNLVEERAATDARFMAALRILDTEKQDFLQEYTTTRL